VPPTKHGMSFFESLAWAYVAFVPSAVPISYAAWPKTRAGYRAISSMALAAILVVFNAFWLATTQSGITLGGLLLCSGIWLILGVVIYLAGVGKLSIFRPGRRMAPPAIARSETKKYVLVSSAVLFAIGLLLIPVVWDLSSNLLWRYRAYMAALAGVAILGVYTRKKAKTVLLGLFLIFSVSLANLLLGLYPTGMPLLHAESFVTEAVTAKMPFADTAGLKFASALISRIAVISDTVVMGVAVVLVGVSGVVLTNALLSRPSGRTIISLILVLVLLVPGILIPHVYTIGVGSLEFGANLGIGASEANYLVDLVQKGEISNATLSEATLHLRSAGDRFLRSERLLAGLERLRLFQLVGFLPIVGEYSGAARSIAWALPNAAIGLQTCALGAVTILDGILCIFGSRGSVRIDSFDVVGRRLMNEDLDADLVRQGILRIDSAFLQVMEGFPRIRSSLGNLSQVQPQIFEEKFPGVSSDLRTVLASAAELADGMDAMEVFLRHANNGRAPATSFLFASYALARLAPRFTDIRRPEQLPDMRDVVLNLSDVSAALGDPAIRRLRNQGGDVGNSLSFLSDTVDLTQQMAGLGDHAKRIAVDIESIRARFGASSIQNLTEIQLEEWERAVEALIDDADDLAQRTKMIEEGIQLMMVKTANKQYGYANDLAASSVGLLEGAMDLLGGLERLSELSLGLNSLVDAARSFRDFHYQLERLQRQVELGNWGIVELTLDQALGALRSGKMQTENSLAALGWVAEKIELPFDTGYVERALDAAASLELKLVALEGLLAAQDQEAAMGMISDIRSDFAQLSEELKLKQST